MLILRVSTHASSYSVIRLFIRLRQFYTLSHQGSDDYVVASQFCVPMHSLLLSPSSLQFFFSCGLHRWGCIVDGKHFISFDLFIKRKEKAVLYVERTHGIYR